jgi:hypothetical protein
LSTDPKPALVAETMQTGLPISCAPSWALTEPGVPLEALMSEGAAEEVRTRAATRPQDDGG